MRPAERIITQWRTAFGCPVSDEAKAQFGFECLGHRFDLADVRLWIEMHKQRNGKELNTDCVHLEFFFDGMECEIQEDPGAFERAFARMIESQLQEKRCREFRKRLLARKRRVGLRTAAKGDVDGEETEGGVATNSLDDDDREWQSYLKRPAQPTELSIRATREAGCMLRFLVIQSSLSTSASEELGQIAFQEHFPIDGVEQNILPSTKPLPTWVYWMGLVTAIFALITLYAFLQIAKGALKNHAALLPP